ncbi:DHH family phosphoesterase [Desulforhabdus amnigena]|jgi:phosphoesterase RecJ-like protein|uniref:Phosphoesterase n=1 Tax=Desulforhabdus amnigena TaxID=40218 RepID=A0A9W6D490_9BACT|nr:bifunctional oligoribonuclease/PAP phosphatase NrnA [Desulforhabdus amnigena]NLJ29842.1 bifunctional oligoribonuclease/PAP phosphatase NrnA [Deltaproteobacteria bacterium]GLI33882.1 phosphoesterase [Desulforhabdus amnigena]
MNEIYRETIDKIVEAIREHHRFLIVTHIKPDGDAVGSLLGLSFLLRRLGKSVTACTQDPIPTTLEFLAGSESISHEVPQPYLYDVAILVDCGDFPRVGSSFAEAVGRVPFLINIDHHYGNVPFGDICWVNASASSTCEMLYHLSSALSVPLDREIATHLYTGLLTDTGSFRFGNTNQKVLEIAADLVGAGAEPAHIAQQIFDSASPQRLKLLARVLSSVAFHADARLATAELSLKMFDETGTSSMDSDGFINQLRSVKSVEMAMVFRESAEGLVHISMRSKGKVDVATFAQTYGGGGHRQAAAFRSSGDLQTVRAKFTEEARNYLMVNSKGSTV